MVAPVLVVISCGSDIYVSWDSDRTKMQEITKKQIEEAISTRLKEFGTPNSPDDWSATINQLSGVSFNISNWTILQDGNVTMNAIIYKTGLVSREFTDITIDGFSYIPHIITSTPVPLSGVNAIPNAEFGFSIKLDPTHYLIGTKSKGVYQVTLDSNGTVISSTHSQLIPDVHNGWVQKIDDTHYLIGTHSQGVYQVIINSDGAIVSHIHVTSIPDVDNSFITQIDPFHYFIATFIGDIYGVTIDKKGVVTSSIKIPQRLLPNVTNGWVQKINTTHYLVGTKRNGVYQVKVTYFM